MKREFRLRRSVDIKRVRRIGKSYANPLVVLVVARGFQSQVRVAVIAGQKVGDAVERNRAKRRIRAVFSSLLPNISGAWDVLVFARQPARTIPFPELCSSLHALLHQAGLLNTDHES